MRKAYKENPEFCSQLALDINDSQPCPVQMQKSCNPDVANVLPQFEASRSNYCMNHVFLATNSIPMIRWVLGIKLETQSLE